MDELVVSEGAPNESAQCPRPRGWSRPEKRTTDRGRFLTLPNHSAFTVAGTAPDFRRLPFEPPPPDKSVGGTLVCGRANDVPEGCQIEPAGVIEPAMTANNSRIIALLSAIALAAMLRLVPHPPNFTPIGAMALFSGAYFGRRALAFVAPLGALVLSDFVLGFYHGMATVYAATALIVFIGWFALNRISPIRVGLAALASSTLFFIITNFGMWLFSGFYPRTLAGLETCYVAAIPFFQNTIAGDLFYAVLLFGGFRIAETLAPKLRAAAAIPA